MNNTSTVVFDGTNSTSPYIVVAGAVILFASFCLNFSCFVLTAQSLKRSLHNLLIICLCLNNSLVTLFMAIYMALLLLIDITTSITWCSMTGFMWSYSLGTAHALSFLVCLERFIAIKTFDFGIRQTMERRKYPILIATHVFFLVVSGFVNIIFPTASSIPLCDPVLLYGALYPLYMGILWAPITLLVTSVIFLYIHNCYLLWKMFFRTGNKNWVFPVVHFKSLPMRKADKEVDIRGHNSNFGADKTQYPKPSIFLEHDDNKRIQAFLSPEPIMPRPFVNKDENIVQVTLHTEPSTSRSLGDDDRYQTTLHTEPSTLLCLTDDDRYQATLHTEPSTPRCLSDDDRYQAILHTEPSTLLCLTDDDRYQATLHTEPSTPRCLSDDDRYQAILHTEPSTPRCLSDDERYQATHHTEPSTLLCLTDDDRYQGTLHTEPSIPRCLTDDDRYQATLHTESSTPRCLGDEVNNVDQMTVQIKKSKPRSSGDERDNKYQITDYHAGAFQQNIFDVLASSNRNETSLPNNTSQRNSIQNSSNVQKENNEDDISLRVIDIEFEDDVTVQEISSKEDVSVEEINIKFEDDVTVQKRKGKDEVSVEEINIEFDDDVITQEKNNKDDVSGEEMNIKFDDDVIAQEINGEDDVTVHKIDIEVKNDKRSTRKQKLKQESGNSWEYRAFGTSLIVTGTTICLTLPFILRFWIDLIDDKILSKNIKSLFFLLNVINHFTDALVYIYREPEVRKRIACMLCGNRRNVT